MPEPAPKTTAFSTIGWAIVFSFIVMVIIVATMWGCMHHRGGGTGSNPPSATQP